MYLEWPFLGSWKSSRKLFGFLGLVHSISSQVCYGSPPTSRFNTNFLASNCTCFLVFPIGMCALLYFLSICSKKPTLACIDQPNSPAFSALGLFFVFHISWRFVTVPTLGESARILSSGHISETSVIALIGLSPSSVVDGDWFKIRCIKK